MKTEPTNKQDKFIELLGNQRPRTVSNSTAFIDGFIKLANDNVDTITYNAFGVITINFKDGTSCGGLVPWIKAEFIDQEKYAEKYGTIWKMAKEV